ncbi:unnamed protein product [Adineta steineri]|uniref:Uncharacterized protein n=1 Tax=Adineta steineri TaxID=433720 RepID=A0A814K1Z5_9BILA|nr:unnamed protein product [Adineta steineri]CAF1045095.1 unnamed protein product [Adineta steineri]
MFECIACLVCILGCIGLGIGISGSIDFGTERHKEINFVENICLVIDAKAIPHLCSRYLCHAPVWTVEYNDDITVMSSNQTIARITGDTSEKYAKAMNELEMYPIGSKHTCYHHKRASKKTAQWHKPNTKPGLIYLLVGFGLLAVSIIAGVIMYIKYRSNRNRH